MDLKRINDLKEQIEELEEINLAYEEEMDELREHNLLLRIMLILISVGFLAMIVL